MSKGSKLCNGSEMKEYETRKEMLKGLVKPGSVIAEIGVFVGDLAEWIQKELKPSKFYAVDCYEGPVIGSANQDGFNFEFYKTPIAEWFAGRRVPITKMRSSDFFKTIPDGSLDCVYIDGDHSYEGVKADLEASHHKVKHGGWILGHDLCRHPTKGNPEATANCEQAVTEFCLKYGLEVSVKANDGQMSYGIINKKERIHIVSVSNREALYKYTFAILKEYADKQGYSINLHTDVLETTRYPAWSKIPAVKRALEMNDPDSAEYIVWFDDDITVTDPERSLYDFIDKYQFRESEALAMVCHDVYDEGTLMNTGVMVFKNKPETIKMLDTIWELGSRMPLQHQSFSYEQEVFNFYYKFIYAKHILRIPHKTMQSLARHFDCPAELAWSPGDFCAHITAGPLEDRLMILQLLINHHILPKRLGETRQS